MAALPQYDDRMEKLRREAQAGGECLRYVGVIHPGGDADAQPGGVGRIGAKCTVSLQRYPMTHAFARVSGSDNIIAFKTDRYSGQPLIVQGPGAGPEVTAGGIFGDLLRLASSLGGFGGGI